MEWHERSQRMGREDLTASDGRKAETLYLDGCPMGMSLAA
jgi:hypothetical protein